MKPLYFVRHGETDWNREGRLQDQTDIPLNSQGRRQAAIVATTLGDVAQQGLRDLRFIASPMLRTRETMEIMRETLGLPPKDFEQDARLIEIGFGRWESYTWPQVRSRDAVGARAWDADKWGYVPPGGENYAMVMERVADWLSGINDPCCVIAHGGIARVLLVLLAGLSEEAAVMADIWQGKVLVFEKGTAYWVPGDGHV